MFELFQTLFRYNTWATEKLLESLAQLDEGEWVLSGCSGRGSIRETLAHLFTAQLRWTSRFDRSKGDDEVFKIKIETSDIDTLEKAKEVFEKIDTQTKRWVESLDEPQLREVRSWTAPGNKTVFLPLWKLAFHPINHQTHSRGQILAAIRRAGHSPRELDFFFYEIGERI